MKTAKVINYIELDGVNARKFNARPGEIAILQNGNLLEVVHAGAAYGATRVDYSVFKKTKAEKAELADIRLQHKNSAGYNKRPRTYITITQ